MGWPILAAYAQSPGYVFRHITEADGLASNDVVGILQDSKGFMWISTSNGLQKYDGYSFTTFRNDPGDANSLSTDEGACLLEDAEKNIWLNSWPWGFSRFDPKTGRNQRILDLGDHKGNLIPVNACLDQEGNTWFISPTQLGKYDIHTHRLSSLNKFPPGWPAMVFSKSILYDFRTHLLWLGTTDGVCIFDPQKNIFYCRAYNPLHIPALNLKEQIGTLFLDSKNNLWIGIYGDKLFRYNMNTGEMKRITVDHERGGNVTVDCIIEDRGGDLWFSARNRGLLEYSYKTDSFSAIKKDMQNPAGLHYEKGFGKLYGDKDGNIWVATDYGINVFNPGRQKFTSVFFPGQEQNKPSLSHFIVQSFLERKNGDIWLATYGGGIYVYDKFLKFQRTYTCDTVHPGNPYALGEPHNLIWSLLEDPDGRIFIGAQHGWLSIFNPATGKFTNCQPPELHRQTIMDMTFDTKGNIWMGLYGGMAKWDKGKNIFVLDNGDVVDCWEHVDVAINLVMDNENNCWLATLGRGLQKFNPDSGHFTEGYMPDRLDPHSISSPSLSSLVVLNDSMLAMGTNGGGIELFNRRTRLFSHITTANGLPGNSVAAVSFHPPYDLWVATGQGICKVNILSKKATMYGLQDGIGSNRFGDLVRFGRRKNGQLMAGFAGGFVCFNPDSISAGDPPKNVSLTGVNVFDRPLSMDSILDRSNTVDFTYKQNFISIQYASLDYMESDRIQYYYQLEGIDKDWINARKRRIAYYTNLPAGKYTFRVKCENEDGVPSENITSLFVIIHPPFWQTWWFYVLCALAILSIAYSFFAAKVRELKMKLEFRNAVARDLHDDLGSTLSGINIYSRLALEKIRADQDESESLLAIISERSEKMMDSLSDMVWSLNSQNDTMENIVSKMKEYATEMLDRQGIACEWSVNERLYGLKLRPATRKEFYLIFKEAINNASKYSRAAKVKICLSAEGKELALLVSDDGKGFDKNLIHSGNGIGNMTKRAKNLGGILKIDTNPGNGVAIYLCILLP